MNLPVIAVVGRPNVGKSTLFNRILGSRDAVVAEESGVTRDQHIRVAEWMDRTFLVVDTGGIIPYGDGDQFHESVSAIARDAIAHADAIILVVDVRSGITDQDMAVARELRGQDQPVIVAVNKAEAGSHEADVHDFHRLGLGDPFPVSALHGEGVGDLLEAICADLPERGRMPDEEDMRVALVGRPNVGKSSLLNSLVGRERVLVSEIAGTTRDAIDTVMRWHGKSVRLIDTAGIRRKTNHKKGVEYFSSLRTLEAIQRCDVAVLLLDAQEGVLAQDARIAGEIHETGRGCLVVWNKWDAVEKDDRTYRRFEDDVRDDLRFLSYAPIVTISASERTRIGRILEHCDQIVTAREKQVETSRLNDILQKALTRNPPGYEKGARAKVFYATQTGTSPPRFTIFVNRPELFPRHYIRYLNNQVRKAIGFTGTRIYLNLRKRT